jgi:hypothetical protein
LELSILYFLTSFFYLIFCYPREKVGKPKEIFFFSGTAVVGGVSSGIRGSLPDSGFRIPEEGERNPYFKPWKTPIRSPNQEE